MGRPKKRLWCPYRSRLCDGQDPKGDKMCERCLSDYMKTEAWYKDKEKNGQRSKDRV